MSSCQKDKAINPSVVNPDTETTLIYGVNPANLPPEAAALLSEIDPEDSPMLAPEAPSCGSDEHIELLMLDAEYKKECIKDEREFKAFLQNQPAESRLGCSNTIYIPVAIHFQDRTSGYQHLLNNESNRGLLTFKAVEQIRLLNNAFQQKNSQSIFNTYNFLYPSVSTGKTCIEFFIPQKNHPQGSGVANGQYAVTFNQTTGNNIGVWAGYLNIFVGEAYSNGKRVLGYAPVNGNPRTRGLRIDNKAFGGWDIATRLLHTRGFHHFNSRHPYDEGMTLVHEMGHYLGLNHIWGGGCSKDDGIADTPNSNAPYYGNPASGGIWGAMKVSCETFDLWMNFMDYTDDDSMDMFTSGQASTMNSRANYLKQYKLKTLEELGY